MKYFSTEQLDKIHQTALKILAEVGVHVENERLLDMLTEFGGKADISTQNVRFNTGWVKTSSLIQSQRICEPIQNRKLRSPRKLTADTITSPKQIGSNR